MTDLQLDTLNKALDQLARGLAEAEADPANELKRDGVIQRFEYVYELTHKMIRRFFHVTAADAAAIDALSFPDLIRMAHGQGLTNHSWDTWLGYRAARGTTSHSYNSAKAQEIFQMIPGFLAEAVYVQGALQRKLNADG